MATCFSHPAVPLAIACWFPSLRRPPLLLAGALLSSAPDLDAIGYFAGVPYGAWCGHRGCTHSLAFAVGIALLLTPWLSRRTRVPRWHVFAFLFASWASHGLIDMATNGGLGIALLWPFADARLFWPAQPIEVAPLGIRAFFSSWGLDVLASEALWIWLPAIMLGAPGLVLRRPRRERQDAPATRR
jgi:inner membrane protein